MKMLGRSKKYIAINVVRATRLALCAYVGNFAKAIE